MNAFIAITWMCFLMHLNITGYSTNANITERLTYMFAHANIIHLFVNSYSIWMMNKAIKNIPHKHFNIIKSICLCIALYTIAVLATFGSEQNIPTIGASAIPFAMAGVWLAYRLDKAATIAITITAIINIIITFIAPVNALNHLLGFIYGFIYGIITNKRIIKKLCRQ